MRRTKADVIHVHGTGLHFSGRRFLQAVRAPVVFTPYSLTATGCEVACIRRRAARVIALSEFMREGLVNRCRIPRETLRVVPPGVDLKLYDFLPPRIGERIPVVGAVAPLEPERGQSVFLRAVKILAGSVREAEFIVAGDGREERSLRNEAAALGIEKRVTFVTRLANYRGAISALDIFVRPALAGGLGYGVLEAMAMGKAVVATSTGSVPEMVVEGKTARLVAKGDAAALAEAVGQLLAHPQAARDLGAAARLSVAERFSMQRLVADTVAVYAEAIEETEAMTCAVIIPARFGSTRFPGKVLMRGPSGKPLIQYAWEAATRAEGVDETLVATDDERIAQAVRAFGGEARMTQVHTSERQRPLRRGRARTPARLRGQPPGRRGGHPSGDDLADRPPAARGPGVRDVHARLPNPRRVGIGGPRCGEGGARRPLQGAVLLAVGHPARAGMQLAAARKPGPAPAASRHLRLPPRRRSWPSPRCRRTRSRRRRSWNSCARWQTDIRSRSA